ncbi:MAG: DMT family transporter [Pseudolabrys sp.]|nr:DMT family transporter [Pseudolabrys sp.]
MRHIVSHKSCERRPGYSCMGRADAILSLLKDVSFMPPARRPSHHEGMLSMTASMGAFVVGDAVLKYLGQAIPTQELVVLRGAIIIAGIAALLAVRGQRLNLNNLRQRPVWLRCLFDAINIISFVTAITHLNLAALYALLLTAPLMMTILAVVLVKEPVGWRRWSAIIVGFIGALLVIKPDPNAFDHWALIGLLAAFGAAGRDMATRYVDPGTSTPEVTLYSAALAALVAGPFALVQDWSIPATPQALLIVVQAVAWIAGTMLLIHACRIAPLSIVAAFRYTLLIFGTIAGYLVFADVPDAWTLTGAALIVACGLYTFHREQVRGRPLATKAAENAISSS